MPRAETLNNATLNIGNKAPITSIIMICRLAVLTLGPNLTIDQAGTNAELTAPSTAAAAGSSMRDDQCRLDRRHIHHQVSELHQPGDDHVSNGDTLSLASSSWSNSGTIAVTGGTLGLQGNGLTLAQLGTVTHTGGVVNLQTTLNDTGATLNVGTSTALGTLTLTTSGTIENGTIVDQGSGIAFSGGTLSGVTYDGTMSLSTTSSYVYLTNGLTLPASPAPAPVRSTSPARVQTSMPRWGDSTTPP